MLTEDKPSEFARTMVQMSIDDCSLFEIEREIAERDRRLTQDPAETDAPTASVAGDEVLTEDVLSEWRSLSATGLRMKDRGQWEHRVVAMLISEIDRLKSRVVDRDALLKFLENYHIPRAAIEIADALLASNLLVAVPGREEIARLLAGLFGPGWDLMYENKREWIDDRGARQPDVNGPFRNDCLDAADAILALFKGAE